MSKRKLLTNNLSVFKNKYVLGLMIFGIWMIIFDQNNLFYRYKTASKLRQLEKDKLYYQEKIKNDSSQINQLRSSNKNLEKFARETYLMKRDNEDIYIILEED